MFTLLTSFIVLIERRRLARRLLAAISAVAIAASGFAPTLAHARKSAFERGFDRVHKVARDLGDELDERAMPKHNWSRKVGGAKVVQAVIVSDSPDPTMSALGAHVEQLGGSVIAVHGLVHAMTVQIPARHVRTLAKRDDVISISPNRETQRTASTLESITGALTPRVRATSSKTSYAGLDGSGVGIAILDSGVMREHWAFADANAGYRVKRHVNMLGSAASNWTAGTAVSPVPNSSALANYEAAIENGYSDMQDAYGHGTHVASVAGGLAKFYAASTPDATGVAPNANLYDVK